MNRYLTSMACLFICAVLPAQNSIGEVLEMVEANNPQLRVAALRLETARLENRSDVLPDSPEVEFNYLWGENDETGRRNDFRVTQSLDMATLSGARSRREKARNLSAELEYKAERMEVLLEAKELCIELIYNNILYREFSRHAEDAGTLVRSLQRKMELGGASVLELNKARLHLASVEGQLSRIDLERAGLLSGLRRLNGGEELAFDAVEYDDEYLPDDFQTWYEEASALNPVLGYVRQQIEIDKTSMSVEKLSWLPELKFGYMSELGLSERYRGLTLGLSLPLWANSNKVSQARSRLAGARLEQVRAEAEFYENLRREYDEALRYRRMAESYKTSLDQADPRDYLLEANTKGEISMLDYLVEADLYYDSLQEYLEAERDYRLSLSRLGAVNLIR